jgi:glutamate--cysteine ligase
MPAPQRTLSLSDVRRFVDEQCFPTGSAGRVGAELEWLAVEAANPTRRASLDCISSALDGVALPAGSRISTEPGGQIELSSTPAPDVGGACTGLAADLAVARHHLSRRGVALVGTGIDADHRPRRLVDSPRYRAMEAFFDGGGEHEPRAGRTMMCNTASVQVNVDATGSGPDRDERWARAHALGPVLAAAFANSPVAQGRPTGWRSARLAAWQAIDRSRTAPAFAGRGCVDDWSGYALAARVMMIRTGNGGFAPVTTPLPFAQWMAEGHRLGWPTIEDYGYHLTTLFPPVRPKGWLELRMLDALPDPWWRVAVAVCTAVIDDPETAEAATAAATAGGATPGASSAAWSNAARRGLADPGLAAAADASFRLALGALPRLGVDPLTTAATEEYAERFVARRRCPADASFNGIPA